MIPVENKICQEFAHTVMASLLSHYRDAVTSNAWFDGLSKAIQEAVLARARPRHLVRGQRLYARGEDADGFYRVVEGSVCISGTMRDGREVVLDFYGPGVWFAEVSVLGGLPRSHDASAYEETQLLQLALTDLEDLLALPPELSRALLRLEAQRLRLLLVALESYSAQSLEQRLANRLLMLALSHGVRTRHGVEIQIHLPQELLGQLVGATRQRVNQILKDWEFDGLVERPQYGRILLRDPDGLERLAQM